MRDIGDLHPGQGGPRGAGQTDRGGQTGGQDPGALCG